MELIDFISSGHRYLKETLQSMCANYSRYTPLVDVETFIRLFRELQAERRKLREDQQMMINNKMRGDEERDGSAGGDRMDVRDIQFKLKKKQLINKFRPLPVDPLDDPERVTGEGTQVDGGKGPPTRRGAT